MERNVYLPGKPQHELAGCADPPRGGLLVRMWSGGFKQCEEGMALSGAVLGE